jgi:hypothetical protein
MTDQSVIDMLNKIFASATLPNSVTNELRHQRDKEIDS